MSETWIIAAERARVPASIPLAVPPPTFHCPACAHPRTLTEKHESGYCSACIERGRRFWLDRWDLYEIAEVANLIWPEDFYRKEVAA